MLILADDLGIGDLGCYGGLVPTPQIDRLATEGIRLTSFYASAAECTPTRTALLTGRYPQRPGGLECAIGIGNVGRYNDAIRLRTINQLGLPAEDSVLGHRLAAAGVAILMAGKWHLGYEPHFWPDRHGFQRWFTILGGGVDYFHHVEPDIDLHVVYRDGKPVTNAGVYLTDWITDEALEAWRAAPPPRFLYVPYTAPHVPMQGPDDRRASPVTTAEVYRGTPETYAAMVRRLDDNVGRLLAELDRTGQTSNTLVIFTSDNGGPKWARNGPFSGHKGTLWEGGIRAPCLLRWPGRLPAGSTSDQVAATMDLTASILALLAPTATSSVSLDGVDVIATIRSGRVPFERRLFRRGRRGDVTWRAVRNGRPKYLVEQRGTQRIERLFDLVADPAKRRDPAADRPDDVRRLTTLLTAWEQEVTPRR